MSKNIVRVVDGNKVFFNWRSKNYIGYAVVGDDGYYHFMFKQEVGFWDGYVLREIAENLDELNYDWDMQIRKEITKELDKKFKK